VTLSFRLNSALVSVGPRDSLTATADRFGATPVYWTRHRHAVVVATSQRRLARFAGGLDPLRLLQALSGVDVPLLRGVRRVPPGAMIDVRRGQVRVLTRPAPSPLNIEGLAADQLDRDLENRLRMVVEGHLAHHPANLLLSGGLDSAVLLALASEHAPTAWSIDDAAGRDELMLARETARHFGATHRVIPVSDRRLVDAFEGAVLASESLLFNARAVARHVMHRELARAGVSAVLSGVGADEVLMGVPNAASGVGRATMDDALLDRILRGVTARPCRLVPQTLEEARAFQLGRSLPRLVLPPETRAAAAAGIRVRLPFLHPRVTARALGLGAPQLVHGELGKLPLRRAFEDQLPPGTAWRPKTARLAPVGRARKLWVERFESLLHGAHLTRLRGVDPVAVDALLWDYARGEGDMGATERVLMRLASLSVLAAGLE